MSKAIVKVIEIQIKKNKKTKKTPKRILKIKNPTLRTFHGFLSEKDLIKHLSLSAI